jgi:hypothetical protein
MPVSALQEFQLAIVGALRFAFGDRDALTYFDRSHDGFWRSFRAAFVSYPFYLILLLLRVPASEWAASGGARIILVETIGYVILWVLFPLVMLPVCRALGRERRFFDLMVPYNWSQVPQSAVLVLAGLVVLSGGPALRILGFAAAYAMLAYEWFIVRVGLEASGLAAAAVVIVDVVLSFAVGEIAGSLH